MGLKIDRFTWAIVLGVVVLIAAAVVTVAVSGGRGWQSAEYLNEDTPEAVVHDAFLSSVRNEPDVAIKHYSRDVLDDERPFRERFNYYDHGRPARRLRILDVDIDEEEERAYVRIAIDNYRQGGLFDSGTSTYRRTVPLVREEGAWKIDTDDLFH